MNRSRVLGFAAGACLWLELAGTAKATPGQAVRLGGIGAQGPASAAVTALHHNPAMLGALRGTTVQGAFTGGFALHRIRPYAVSAQTGLPTSALAAPQSLISPRLGFFVGASFFLDPVAFGVGFYDLGSDTRLVSSDPLRYHLAPDPDAGCLRPELSNCPPNGGSVQGRRDLTVALAWDLGAVQLGAAVHFPRIWERFAFDLDTELAVEGDDVATARCEDFHSPACAQRVGFKGWNRWIPGENGVPAFDAALTFGVALQLRRETITLGARYRTFPLRRAGMVPLSGVALVCRPDPDPFLAADDVVPPCETATPIDATLQVRLPQEVALGGSFLLGRGRLWRLDVNAYWLDLCPGGVRPGQCDTSGSHNLRLTGIERNPLALPQVQRYRGATDLYGLELYAAYRARSNVSALFGALMSSPSVREGATNAAFGTPWRVGLNGGARIRLRRSGFVLTPGYAVDLLVPRDVRPGEALFDPEAAARFAASGGDINAQGADLVLDGRGRSTNAGRYFGMLHVFSLSVSWGETPAL